MLVKVAQFARRIDEQGLDFTRCDIYVGVSAGAFIASALYGELTLEGFQGGASMRRYIGGAVLMGFGSMLAGGCAVGAGLSGAAVFTATAFVAVVSMWLAGALTDHLLDEHPVGALDHPLPGADSSVEQGIVAKARA